MTHAHRENLRCSAPCSASSPSRPTPAPCRPRRPCSGKAAPSSGSTSRRGSGSSFLTRPRTIRATSLCTIQTLSAVSFLCWILRLSLWLLARPAEKNAGPRDEPSVRASEGCSALASKNESVPLGPLPMLPVADSPHPPQPSCAISPPPSHTHARARAITFSTTTPCGIVSTSAFHSH